MQKQLLSAFAGLCFALSPTQHAAHALHGNVDPQASPLEHIIVQRATLPNGLRVVLSPDHTVPTVAIAVYYDVGSRNEVKGRSGFAHLFEHMMFQGSKNVGKGEHFNLIMNRGGSMNGTTSVDRTNYYETLPSNELDLGLWLEADRMRSLNITQSNFENQRQTVMEERRQSYDNQPYAQSMLRINELAYGDYWPYAHSTIGDMADLQRARLSDVQAFFDTYYAPNNAVLSIVGEFEVSEAMALVKKHFGGIKRTKTPSFKTTTLPAQNKAIYEKMTDPNAELPAFHIAYRIPRNRHADHYALEVLAMVLGAGESSRLYQKLVKDREWVQEIQVGTDDRRGPDLFSVWAVLSRNGKADDVRKVIFDELNAIAKEGISHRELDKIKNKISSIFVFGLQSNLARAEQLAEYELYWGNAELLRSELANYLKVTENDVERVAKTYFAENARTVLDVVPPSKPDTQKTEAK